MKMAGSIHRASHRLLDEYYAGVHVDPGYVILILCVCGKVWQAGYHLIFRPWHVYQKHDSHWHSSLR